MRNDKKLNTKKDNLIIIALIAAAILILIIALAGSGEKNTAQKSPENPANQIKQETTPAVSTQTEPKGETVTVTIPEGFNINQIAEILEQNNVCSKDDFYKAVNSDEYVFFTGGAIPLPPGAGETRLYRLEGYLFPGTYTFYIGEGAQPAAERFLDSFHRRVTVNYDGESDQNLFIAKRAEELNMTVDEILAIASIIEMEWHSTIDTGNVEEIQKHNRELQCIASIFYNRLSNPNHPDGMKGKLQSDVTSWYPYPNRAAKKAANLSEEENAAWEKMAANYDTMKKKGPPSGPLCSPGYNAIYAACYPKSIDDKDYYFFFFDDFGEIYFSERYAEQQEKYKQAIAEGKIG